MGDRGQLRNREKRVRARSQREQILAWLAPSRVPGDARLRHDGGDPTSRQSATAQKTETPPPGKSQNITSPPLIRWSIQEIRRIAILDSLESVFNPHTSSYGHSGAELAKALLSALTSEENGIRNGRGGYESPGRNKGERV